MGNSAMRKTEARFWMLQNSSLSRALRFAAIALGVGLVMAAGPVRAGDDEDEDDKTFEEKIIEGIMAGIGGTNMENKGIDYRERSPLVVPPKIDLPPPAGTSAEVKAPNWPKDPDEQRRKAAAAARKKENKDPALSARILSPSELQAGKTAAKRDANVESLERELAEKLATKVSIQHGRGGRGKLVISYHSLDELDGILERIR